MHNPGLGREIPKVLIERFSGPDVRTPGSTPRGTGTQRLKLLLQGSIRYRKYMSVEPLDHRIGSLPELRVLHRMAGIPASGVR